MKYNFKKNALIKFKCISLIILKKMQLPKTYVAKFDVIRQPKTFGEKKQTQRFKRIICLN